MFEPAPTARVDMKPGTLYALQGEGGWLYYGQITPEKNVGFFRRRDRELSDHGAVLASPIMSIITIAWPSITRGLRAGRWRKLGRFPLAQGLQMPCPLVQWTRGETTAEVWLAGERVKTTRIDDPSIQAMERMAVWDAEYHLPERLTADFGEEEAHWHVGGPIWRCRLVAERKAKRWDEPWHALPDDWVPTGKE